MNTSLTTRQLQRRENSLLSRFHTGAIRPDSDAVRELVEVHQELEDRPVKPIVIARLIAFRKNGYRTIVEVWDSSTFASFYKFSVQQGNRRSTRQSLRSGCRNEGTFHSVVGLDAIAQKLSIYSAQSNPVIQIKLQIFKKRAYKRLLSVAPEQLGLTVSTVTLPRERLSGRSS